MLPYLMWRPHLHAQLKLIGFQMPFWKIHKFIHTLLLWQVEEWFGAVALTGLLRILHLEILTRFSAVSCLANSSLDAKLLALPSRLCETQTREASTEFIQAQCIWNPPNSLDKKSSGLFQKKTTTNFARPESATLRYTSFQLMHAFYSMLYK